MRKWVSALLAFVLAAGLCLPGQASAAFTEYAIQIAAAEENMQRFAFTNYPGENITFCFDGKMLVLANLPDTAAYQTVLLFIANVSGKRLNSTLDGLVVRGADGRGVHSLGGLSDGLYYLEFFIGKDDETFVSYCRGEELPFRMENGVARFVAPAPLAGNRKALDSRRTDAQALAYYTMADDRIQSSDEGLVLLAEEVTAGLSDDYAKALALHDWVADNIWYDYDALDAGRLPAADVHTTLKSRRAVCEGYANLYTALLRAVDIPARTVLGYALSLGTTGGWTTAAMREDNTNHAWNEVFINGRWILVDTTWDSDNAYENGRQSISNGAYMHRYFDATMEAFSAEHRVAPFSEAHVPPVENPTYWAEASVATAIHAGIVPRAWQTRYTLAANRAEFSALAAALYRNLTGTNVSTAAIWFSDTDDINMLRMGALGVVTGAGDGTASPNGKLTREQAATMLSRLANALGCSLPKQAVAFNDNNAISDWAVEAVGQMQAAGIMSGGTGNMFNPKADYTREQCIMTVLRLYEYCLAHK